MKPRIIHYSVYAGGIALPAEREARDLRPQGRAIAAHAVLREYQQRYPDDEIVVYELDQTGQRVMKYYENINGQFTSTPIKP